MTEQQRLLLYLLKVGLGEEHDVNVPYHASYAELYALACEQTVRGVVMDGLQKTGIKDTGDAAAVMKWYAQVLQIEKCNAVLNRHAAEAYELFRKNGFNPIVAKGPVAALEYPNPFRRECGDIDFYFEEEEGRKAACFLKSQGVTLISEKARDVSFSYKASLVEVHPYMVHSITPNTNKHTYRLHKWFEEEMVAGKRIVNLGEDEMVAAPSPMHSLIYGFYHLWMHFVKGGVGLRQLCDWRMCLHNYYGKYDVEELRQKLETFGLLRPWIGFSAIPVDYLGLPENEMPFYRKSAKAERILDMIFEEGNFGHNNPQKSMPAGKWRRIWRKTTDVAYRFCKLFRLFPQDMAHFMPSWKATQLYISHNK